MINMTKFVRGMLGAWGVGVFVFLYPAFFYPIFSGMLIILLIFGQILSTVDVYNNSHILASKYNDKFNFRFDIFMNVLIVCFWFIYYPWINIDNFFDPVEE
jgi:hypothetical protein